MIEFDQIWTMRDGKEIKVHDMEDSHVKNTLKLKARNIMSQLLNLRVNIQNAFDTSEIDNMTECDAKKLLNDIIINPRQFIISVFKACRPNDHEWYRELGI